MTADFEQVKEELKQTKREVQLRQEEIKDLKLELSIKDERAELKKTEKRIGKTKSYHSDAEVDPDVKISSRQRPKYSADDAFKSSDRLAERLIKPPTRADSAGQVRKTSALDSVIMNMVQSESNRSKALTGSHSAGRETSNSRFDAKDVEAAPRARRSSADILGEASSSSLDSNPDLSSSRISTVQMVREIATRSLRSSAELLHAPIHGKFSENGMNSSSLVDSSLNTSVTSVAQPKRNDRLQQLYDKVTTKTTPNS